MDQSKVSIRAILIPALCGGLIMSFALGTRHVQGLFLLPITLELSWPRESFGFAIAMQNLVWGLAQPFTGMIADRYGAARVVVVGAVIYALGLYLMSLSETPTQFTLSAGLLIGLGLSGTAFGVVYGAVAKAVPPERASWAIGVAGAAGGFGQFLMVPGVRGLISSIGWSQTLVALGACIALSMICALPFRKKRVTLIVRRDPQSMGAAVREAFAHKGFWLLNVGFLACGFQLAFMAVHMPAYLVGNGLSASEGVTALAIIALTNSIGTYYCGYFGGLYRKKYLLAGIYFTRAFAMLAFVLMPLTTSSVYVFSAMMGLLWMGTAPLTTGLVSQIFGLQYVSTIFGFVFLGHQIGGFLGVWLGSVLFDQTGSYVVVWTICIGLGFISGLLHWPIDDVSIDRNVPKAQAILE